MINWLINWFPETNSILDVGCGTGHFTRWFCELGLQAFGLDLSRPMLFEANRLGGLAYLQGDAQMLPFVTKSFDLVAMITTLEFLLKPTDSLKEAIRVARRGIILGVLNAQSHLGRQYKRKGGPIWGAARLFTPFELKRMIREITQKQARVVWRTTLWPIWCDALLLPWGGFIGMAVIFS